MIKKLIEEAKQIDLAAPAAPWSTVDSPWGDGTLIVQGHGDPHGARIICDTQQLSEFADYPTEAEMEGVRWFITRSRSLVPALASALEAALAMVAKAQHPMSCPAWPNHTDDRWKSTPCLCGFNEGAIRLERLGVEVPEWRRWIGHGERCHAGAGHTGMAKPRGAFGCLCDACWERVGTMLDKMGIRQPEMP